MNKRLERALQESRAIYKFKIGKDSFSIRATNHFDKRIKERNIKRDDVLRTVLSLEIADILEMRDEGIKILLIDTKANFSLVLRMQGNRIFIITAINLSSGIYNKPDITTKIILR